MTDRERFLALLAHQPILPGDAVICLAGEDGLPRARMAAKAFWEMAQVSYGRPEPPVLVVTGGKHNPPRWLGAQVLEGELLALGVAPSRLMVDVSSPHTRAQAEAVISLAKDRHWKSLLLVASPYHMYRAYLTFLKRLTEEGLDGTVRLTAVAADQTHWFGCPEGMNVRRIKLLAEEMDKCEAYMEHVATWAEGLAYLERWEGRL